ncbi:MAG: DUF2250 domain-containing protein [Candidatus Zixiibacteriota bacterium]
MADEIKLHSKYVLAKCCKPTPDDEIVGYFSYDDFIKVHRKGCRNLDKAEPERLVTLVWKDILKTDDFNPEDDYRQLDETDFMILRHHREYGVDYSLKVAAMLRLARQAVFDSHKKMREMKLLKRVEPLMIQYRKGVVDNKWIKHRNHTYYDLTEKGSQYLDYYLEH